MQIKADGKSRNSVSVSPTLLQEDIADRSYNLSRHDISLSPPFIDHFNEITELGLRPCPVWVTIPQLNKKHK